MGFSVLQRKRRWERYQTMQDSALDSSANSHQKQKDLEQLLRILLSDECRKHDVSFCALCVLGSIYLTNGQTNNFKHRYSGVSSVLLIESAPNSRKDTYYPEALPYLSSVMDDIILEANDSEITRILGVSDSGKLHLLKMLKKLQDHIELELLRINYSASMNLVQEERLQALGSQISENRKDLEGATRKLETSVGQAHDKLRDAQKDYVTILAIFAAVIISFSGGLGFLADSFAGLQRIDITKLLCLASLVGLILVDLIYLLLRFVWGIIRPDASPKDIPLSRTPIIVFNVFLISVGILTFFLIPAATYAA